MSILPDHTIRALRPVEPFCERGVFMGMSFGLSCAGYDVRVALEGGEDRRVPVTLPPGSFTLLHTLERFTMPHDVAALVKDKSTWARRGLMVQNTFIEPGWRGYLTLELKVQGGHCVELQHGMPIAQIIFQRLETPPECVYSGKYQDQEDRPIPAREEKI
jgi:dCTP deaminase